MNLVLIAITAGYGLYLSVIDIKTHRLPNRHVAAMTVLMTFGIALTANDSSTWASVGVAALGSLAIYSALYLASRGQFGMGDVKYSVPLGMSLGAQTPNQWLNAICLGFLAAGLVSGLLLALRRTTRHSRIAFGPYMTFGALVTLATTFA